ncbi:MAG: hypothetical protein ACO1OB_20090 [Archangium sp.]
MACAQCGAEKGHFYDCSLSDFAAPPAVVAPTTAAEVDDSPRAFERARLLALPIVFAVMLALSFTGIGNMLVRIFFAMWLHELGHAAAAWFTGGFAIPLPWLTRVNDRSVFFIIVEFAALGGWAWWLRQRASKAWWVPLGLAVLLIIGLLLPLRSREALILFMGDGGALVFGALLMATVFLPDGARLAHGGLRWGFLVIGAGGFANIFAEWLRCHRDPTEIAFGRNEGQGVSDPTRLIDGLGWSETRLINSYLTLAGVCLTALLVGWLLTFLRRRSE